MERIDIAVVKLLRLEGGRAFVDDADGKVQHVLVGDVIGQATEVGLRLRHLVGVAQHFQHHSAPAGLERDKLFAAAHGQLAKADLPGLAQRVPQHGIGLLGQIIGRHHEIGLFIIEDVDRIGFHELDEVERLSALDLHRLDLILLQQDIIALRYLEALEDFLRIDRADARDHLVIMNGLARGFMDLTEAHRSAGFGGGVDFDRDGNQCQLDLALPKSACGHVRPPDTRACGEKDGSGL